VIEFQSIESASRTPRNRAKETENESGSDERFKSMLNQYIETDEPGRVSESGAEKKVTRKKENQTDPVEKRTEKNEETHTIKKGFEKSAVKNRVRVKVRSVSVVRGEKRQKAAGSTQLDKKISHEGKTYSAALSGSWVQKRVRNHFLMVRGKKVSVGPQVKAKQKDGNGGIKISDAKEGKEPQKRFGKLKVIARESAKTGTTKGESPSIPESRMNIFAKLLRGNPDQSPSAAGKERMDAGSDLTIASERYEQSVPKLVMKQHTSVLKSTDEIFNEIVRQFSLTVKNGGGVARVVLQPEILGKIKMDLKLNDHRINSLFVVENQSIKDLIMSKLNILENSLLQQGFSLGSFQVEVREKNMGLQASEQGLFRKNRSGYGSDDEQENLVPVSSFTLPWISTIVNVTA
jgi:flagellar hook-length control protein FliK